ncbi:MAG: GntR family transcriptional regulator [Eubacteriales bacterium]|nr:GntR family transcriptional regulator [Eubacteriales bacterium]
MNSDFTIVFNEFMPLKELVFTTLKKAIIKGELQPGDRLMELQLAEKMGVSRTPIREAIHKLAKEGLVTLIPRKGAEVAGISGKTLRDVLQVRTNLEIMAFKLAYENITPEQLKELDERRIAFDNAADGEDTILMAELDENFHFVIYDAAGNNKLREILANLKESMYRYRLEYLKSHKYRDVLKDEHKAMVESLRDRNLEKGLVMIERHIDNQEKAVLLKLKEEQGTEF